MRPSHSGPRAPTGPFHEFYEQLDEWTNNGAVAGPKLIMRGSVIEPQPGTVLTGAGAMTIAEVPGGVSGARCWRIPSAAAGVGRQGTHYGLPLSKSELVDVKGLRSRYRFTNVIWRDNLVAANIMHYGFDTETSARGLAHAAGISGIEACSDPATYGGNWFVRKRLVPVGALVNGPDTGVSATVPRRLTWDYEEGATRRLSLRIDGVTRWTAAGEVELGFDFPGVVTYFWLKYGMSLGGAGSILYACNLAGRIEYYTDPWKNI